MKNDRSINIISSLLVAVLGFGLFFNINQPKQYKIGDFNKEENAYVADIITDPAGYMKAEKFITPSDNYYNTQKNYSFNTIGNIESTWNSYTGKGTKIAIIDEGFAYNHPEYTRKDGTSAISDKSAYFYVSGSYVVTKYYSDDHSWIDESYDSKNSKWNTHGTNTSTTAAAPMNNGGVVGIAPDAEILALKIDMQFASIKSAITYAINQGVDVINMSIGAYAEQFEDGFGNIQNEDLQPSQYTGLATYLNSACQSAYNNGIIVVAAAGNHATYHKSYPACNSKVIGVGALAENSTTKLAPFTNYVGSSQSGEINVDILAPGYVYTAGVTGTSSSSYSHNYHSTQGTSFSSPIVAGAACLWKEKYPNGTPDEFLSQLQSKADGIGDYQNKTVPASEWKGTDQSPANISQGRLNVYNLLDMNEPYVTTVQSSFGVGIGETRQIEIKNSNGSLTYASDNTDVATVSDSGLITAKGAGSAEITVTATIGSKTATATVSVNVDDAIAIQSMEFDPNEIELNVGATYEAEPTLVVTPSNGTRVFIFVSSNDSVASVDEDTGVITAISEGTTTIEAISLYGEGHDELSVTVKKDTSGSWSKITSTDDLTAGDYLLVYESGNLAFNGGLTTLDASSNTISVSISNNSIPYSTETEAAKFTIASYDGGYSLKAANGKYISGTSGNNILNSSDTAQKNTISFDNGNAEIVSNTSHLRYNTSTNQERFRYYKSTSYSSQQAIQLYKLVSGGSTPTVTSVDVTPSTLTLDVYNNPTGNLSATVNGTNNPPQTVTWSVVDSTVASVSNGTVTALKKGTTTVRATSSFDNTKYGECSLTVNDSTPKSVTSIDIDSTNAKTSYVVGETFTTEGLVVTAHYSDSSTANVTSSCNFSGGDTSSVGTKTVTVSYTFSGKTVDNSYSITVTSDEPVTTRNYMIGWGNASGTAGTYTNFTSTSGTVSNILSFSTAKNQGTNDPAYNSSNKELRLYYNSSGNGNSITITPAEKITFTGFTLVAKQSYDPTIKYFVDGGTGTNAPKSGTTYSVDNFEASSSLKIQNANTSNTQLRVSTILITYTVEDTSDKIVNSLTATYSGGDVYVGGSLDTSAVSVTAKFTNSTKYPDEPLASTDYSLSGFSSQTAGTKEVTVTYTGEYSTSTPTITTTFNVTVIEDIVIDVSVNCSKSIFHPGETISKSNLTVTLIYQSGNQATTTDYEFSDNNYQFTYDDAPSGGVAKSKQFSIIYAQNAYNFSVNVTRVAYQEIPSGTDTLNRAFTGRPSSTSYGNWSSKTGDSGSVYAGNSAGGNDSIQLRSSDSSGIVMTSSGGKATKIVVTWQSSTSSGRVLNVYGKNTAYSSASDLYNSSSRGTSIGAIVYGTSTELVISGDYSFIGLRSNSGAMYLSEIKIYIGGGADNPTNVSNFIMYEDTKGQCEGKDGKLNQAIAKLNTMSDADKLEFSTSKDYVISTARARLNAWAKHEGKVINLTNNNFVLSSSPSLIEPIKMSTDNNVIMTVVVVTTCFVAVLGGFIYLKKREEK